ncbi:hypothetical protein CYMTET_7866 [Cymbomonas tetramitiformis]|uniref:Uncharacterized protein n=1 Tax=Cymbomonas tetramitiformis TaxID=36881 RepID=A0AAE0GU60_9CHLO|nr:hypothetical protein CYMTET_7866 [Cymbomonas tetramitiformis]
MGMEKELDPSGEEEGVDGVDGSSEVGSETLQVADAPAKPHLELLQELEEKLFLSPAVRDVEGAVEGLRELSRHAFNIHHDASRTPAVTPWSLWYPFPDGTTDPASSKPPPPPKSSTQRPPPPQLAFPADSKKFPDASANLEERRVKNLEVHAPRWLEGSGGRAWAGIGEVHTPPGGRYGDGNSELEVSANALFLMSVLASSGIAPAVVPHDEKWALEALKKAVSGGSLEAAMAIGDRLVSGRGMKQNCQAGLWHLWAVADKVLTEAEATGDFQLPREPVSPTPQHPGARLALAGP